MKSEGSTFPEVSWVLPQALQIMPQLVHPLVRSWTHSLWSCYSPTLPHRGEGYFHPARGRHRNIKKITSPQQLLRKLAWGPRLPESRTNTCDEPRTRPLSNRWAWDSISEHRAELRAGFFYKQKLKSGGKEGAEGFPLPSSWVAARGGLVHRTRPT